MPRAAPRPMKIFPLNKGGGAQRQGVVYLPFPTYQDNPLKAPRPPSLRDRRRSATAVASPSFPLF